MNTLEEMLERSGYNRRLKENEDDLRSIETAKRDAALRGEEPPAALLEFEEAVHAAVRELAREYEATVTLVDARNDVELEMLQLEEKLQLAAERFDETDPAKATHIRAAFGLDDDQK